MINNYILDLLRNNSDLYSFNTIVRKQTMKAIILAAGCGNRMRSLTDNIHKTLLSVNNQTIIERIINSLYNNNVKNITIVTG